MSKLPLAQQIETWRRGLLVRRYHQRFTHEPDTVGKHSAGVALFVNMIDPTARKELILAAISHDLGEVELGDIPAPTKRALDAKSKAALDRIENEVLDSLGHGYELTGDEHLILKIADYCDGLCYSTEELRRGNKDLYQVGANYSAYLLELKRRIPSHAHWANMAANIIETVRFNWGDSN